MRRFASPAPSPEKPTAPPVRLAFVDNLRLVLVALVVAHHAGQAYGPTGGRWPLFEDQRAWQLGPFFSVNAAFFMGLFFLIAGYFTPRSVDRKGPGAFALHRLVRLGVPLLVFPLLVHHPVLYFAEGHEEGFWSYLGRTLASGEIEVGHLWFVGHLLVYGALYALVRRFTPPPSRPVSLPSRGPTNTAMLVFALLLAIAGGVVRIWFPQDRWVWVLPILPVEFAHLPQYAALFVVGVLTRRRDWFRSVSRRRGRIWLGLGILLVLVAYMDAAVGQEPLEGSAEPMANSFGRAALENLWEGMICVSLCAGLLALFRRRFNRQGARTAALARASYAAYILHLPIVVGLQFALLPLAWTPLAKFGTVTATALPLSFLVGLLLRRLPLLRSFL